MLNFLLQGTRTSAAAADVSPTWSVYDEFGGSARSDESEGAPKLRGGMGAASPPRPVPLISFPEPTMTLKGASLKKKAPLRRGAQGAVYSAYDTGHAASIPKHLNDLTKGREAVADEENGDNEIEKVDIEFRGRPVAVKRIFLQASDFGSRDLSATVLREVTLHRFVSAKQEAYLTAAAAAATATWLPSSSVSVEQERNALTVLRGTFSEDACCLLDSSAQVIPLYRVVEAPHRELCLVMELAATNLDHVIQPHGGRGRGDRRKPGVVSLFRSVVPRGEAAASPPSISIGPEAGGNGADPRVAPPGARLPLVRYLMRRLLRVVCFLHEVCGVVHRDVKLSNILVTQNGDLRLGDFGSARFLPARPPPGGCAATAKSLSSIGTSAAGATPSEPLLCTPPSMRTTLQYRPPEVLLGDRVCRPASDMWALGVVFAQLLLQRNLFCVESELHLLGAIHKLLGSSSQPTVPHDAASAGPTGGTADVRSVRPFDSQASLPYKFHAGILPATGLDLLRRLLCVNPESRITAREALRHQFFTTFDDGVPGSGTTSEEDDDMVGRLLWLEKVASAQAGDETAGVRGWEERQPHRSLLHSLEHDEKDESDGDDDDVAAPFHFHLSSSFTPT